MYKVQSWSHVWTVFSDKLMSHVLAAPDSVVDK
jgi:hypothetical protein